MNNIRYLLSVEIKKKLRFYKLQETSDGKKRVGMRILMGIAIGYAVLVFLGLYIAMMAGCYYGGVQIGKPEMVLTIGFVISQLVVLIFGVISIMNDFYFAKDTEILLPLPIKTSSIVSSKILMITAEEYLFSVPLILVPALFYGIGQGMGVLYWLYTLVILLAAPIIPLVIDALILMALFRVFNLKKYKTVIMTVVPLLFSIGILAFSYASMQMGNTLSSDASIDWLLSSVAGLSDQLLKFFPPAMLITAALSAPVGMGSLYFLIYLAATAVLFWLLLWLSNHAFAHIAEANMTVGAKKKKTVGQKAFRQRGLMRTLFSKEWRTFIKEPSYLINTISLLVMLPILVVFETSVIGQDGLAEVWKQPQNLPYVTVVFIIITILFNALNLSAYTAISREGKNFWISRMIPAAPSQQVVAKLLVSTVFSAAITLCLAISALVIMKITLVQFIVLIAVGIVSSMTTQCVDIMIDLYKPRLNWENPREIMKSGSTAMFATLFAFAIILVFGAISITLLILGVNEYLVYLVIAAIFGGAFVPVFRGMQRYADRRYQEIEV